MGHIVIGQLVPGKCLEPDSDNLAAEIITGQ